MPASAYLDNNATTPVAEEVIAAMLPWFRQQPGNPSSLHGPGEAAHAAISKARIQVAKLLGGVRPGEVMFLGSATEAINTAVHAALTKDPARQAIITSTVEHAATSESVQARAGQVLEIPVDADGSLEITAALEIIAEHGSASALVTLLVVNNETGHIQNHQELRAIADAAHAAGALVHFDVVQAAGKIAIDLVALGADMASLSAHKLHGPKGVGALWVCPNAFESFPALIHGGPQESERRAGTENVAGIVGFGAAAAMALQTVQDPQTLLTVAARRDRLESALIRELKDVIVASKQARRVASCSYVEFHGIDGEAALMMLSQYNIQVSTGSACGASHHGPSHVLLAMGRDEAQATSSLRFSLSRETSDAEIDHAIATVPGVISTLRTLAGIPY